MVTSTSLPTNRLISIDAYRGLVILLMLAEILHFTAVSYALPDSEIWEFLAFHQSHVNWSGCSLHDLIQPSFAFLVGFVVPYSLASSQLRGDTSTKRIIHALLRSTILIGIGIFLESLYEIRTVFTFHNTLTQIGLGYFFLDLLGQQKWQVQIVAFFSILIGYWGLFAWYPAPGTDFDWDLVNVPKDWRDLYALNGFSSHWNKNSNAAWAFDVWWLNLFHRESPFTHNTSGQCTLSFIPMLGMMLLGSLTSSWLQSKTVELKKLLGLILGSVLCFAIALTASRWDVCPIVKSVWTPAWVFYSGGWCLAILAAFYWVIEIWRLQKWAFPLVVMGSNSIVAYCSGWMLAGPIASALIRHFGEKPFEIAGTAYASVLQGAAVLLVLWLMLYWLYRNRVFVRL